MLYSRVIIEPKGGGEPVSVFTSPVAPDVELDTFLSYHSQRFGEPFEVAFTEDTELGRVAIGWVFDLPDGFEVPGSSKDYEIVVIPVETDDSDPNTLRSAFLRMEKEKAVFRHLADEGKFDSYTEHTAPQREYGGGT